MEKIRITNEELEIVSIRQDGSLLIIEFQQIADLSNKDLSAIDIYTSGGIKCTKEPITGFNTIYKVDGNTVILSNDGSVYTEPEPPIDPVPIEPHVPTESEIAQQNILQLKAELEETDYMIIKCSEYQLSGLDMPYDIARLHAERQALRDQINELELSLS